MLVCSNFDEWNSYLTKVTGVYNSCATRDWIKPHRVIEQVFFHIFQGMNPEITQDPNVIEKIQFAIENIQTKEELDALLLAMQVFPSIEDSLTAVRYKQFKAQPPRAFFRMSEKDFAAFKRDPEGYCKLLGSEGTKLWAFFKERGSEWDLVEEKSNWLTFYGVYRSRNGLVQAHNALKYCADNPVLLSKALSAIERIGIQRWDKNIENWQKEHLLALLKSDLDPSLKVQICKTLWMITRSAQDEELKNVFADLLVENLQKQQIPQAVAMIELLGHFNTPPTKPPANKILHEILKSPFSVNPYHPDICFSAAKAMAKMQDEEGLLLALYVVINSTIWERMKSSDGADTISQIGSYLMFRHRPAELHDNKHAMAERILAQIVQLKWNDPAFRSQVDAMTKSPQCQKYMQDFDSLPRERTRFIGLPIYFPENAAIARGLSDRKGQHLFERSIVDLLRKGCGTSDVSDEEVVVDGQTWARVGHIFGSPTASLFFDPDNPYFKQEGQGVLIITSGAVYNAASRAGVARLESEALSKDSVGTLNTIFYEGISKEEIQAIFLPNSCKADLEALTGNTPTNQLQLTSPTFQKLTEKDLVQMRRILHQNNFKQKIYFIPDDGFNAGQIEATTGLRFVSDEEIKQESVRRLAARLVIQNQLGWQDFA